MKDIIANLKAKQNSQVSEKATPAPVLEQKEEEETEEEETEDEVPKETKGSKPKLTKEEMQVQMQQAQAQQIMMLQDNGIFRGELLNQLREINQALVVVAKVLVELTGNDGKE